MYNEKSKFGIIVILDALGVSNYGIEEAVGFIEKRDELISNMRKVEENMKKAEEYKHNCPDVQIFTFADSIILMWNTNEDNVTNILPVVSQWLRPAIGWGIQNKILLRGCMTIGHYVADDKSAIGPAIVDAVAWCDTADWFGIILTPKCKYYLDRLIENVTHNEESCYYGYDFSEWFLKYEVPFKNTKKSMWVISWPYYLLSRTHEEETAFERLVKALMKYPIPKGTESKYENSVEFFKSFEKGVFPRIKNKRVII